MERIRDEGHHYPSKLFSNKSCLQLTARSMNTTNACSISTELGHCS